MDPSRHPIVPMHAPAKSAGLDARHGTPTDPRFPARQAGRRPPSGHRQSALDRARHRRERASRAHAPPRAVRRLSAGWSSGGSWLPTISEHLDLPESQCDTAATWMNTVISRDQQHAQDPPPREPTTAWTSGASVPLRTTTTRTAHPNTPSGMVRLRALLLPRPCPPAGVHASPQPSMPP